ncbi:MAG TPA: hypothetical protein PLE24_08230 [Chitinispirillaceae bacterium]|jgi:hypothetical protein|nr:hypothetical protein [Chitinispirillaceae bacterium]
MYKKLLLFLIISTPVFAVNIPGQYRCKALRLVRTAGSDVYVRSFSTPSLFLNFQPGTLTLSGEHSEFHLSEKFNISKTSGDTLFAEVNLSDRTEKVLMLSRGDTLIIDFAFENEEASFTVNVMMLIEAVKQNQVTTVRKSRTVRDTAQSRATRRDLLGRSRRN